MAESSLADVLQITDAQIEGNIGARRAGPGADCGVSFPILGSPQLLTPPVSAAQALLSA